MDVLKLIKKIERRAYPAHMREINACRNWDEFLEYCEANSREELILIVRQDFYLIAVDRGYEVEIVDMASIGRCLSLNIFRVINELKARIGEGRRLIMDARKSTTYPIIKRLVRRYGWKVIEEDEWDWEGEKMIEMIIET